MRWESIDRSEKAEDERWRKKKETYKKRGKGNESVGYNMITFDYYNNE